MAETRTKRQRTGHRVHLSRTLAKTESIITKVALTEDDVDEIRALLEIVNSKILMLENYDSQITETCDMDSVQTETDDIQTHTVNYKIRAAVIKQKLERKVSPNSASINNSRSSANDSYKLKRLSLASFGGSQIDWLSFYQDFVASVDSNDNMSGITKFRYLKDCLHGEARRAIDGLPITNSSYAQAMQILKSRYHDVEKMVETYMKAIIAIQPPTEDPTALLSFHDTVETYIRALTALGKTEDAFGDLIRPVLKSKLPP